MNSINISYSECAVDIQKNYSRCTETKRPTEVEEGINRSPTVAMEQTIYGRRALRLDDVDFLLKPWRFRATDIS